MESSSSAGGMGGSTGMGGGAGKGGMGGAGSGGNAGMGGAAGSGESGGMGGAGPICGNGQVEGNETCDGNCTTSCVDDGNACTAEALTGSAGTCDAACQTQAITMCMNGDNCCPAGCTVTNDFDCAICDVTVPDDFATIAAAIQAAPAPGTVCIRAGTYTENLTLRAHVSLQGAGDATRIEGNVSVENLASADATPTNLRDLLIHAGIAPITACPANMPGALCTLSVNGQTVSLAMDRVTIDGDTGPGTVWCAGIQVFSGSLVLAFRDSLCKSERGIRFSGGFSPGMPAKYELEVVRSRFHPQPTLGWTYDSIEFLIQAGNSCGALTPAAGSVAKATIVNNEFVSSHYDAVYLTPCLAMNAADAMNSGMFLLNNTFVPDQTAMGDLAFGVWYNALGGYGPDFVYANNLYVGANASNPVRGIAPDLSVANLGTTMSPFVDLAATDLRLMPGSAAIDAADPQYAPTTDNRGSPRPVDGNGDGTKAPDIGAHEYMP